MVAFFTLEQELIGMELDLVDDEHLQHFSISKYPLITIFY